MSDLNPAAIIADDSDFNLTVRNKAFEIVAAIGSRDITDDEIHYVLHSLYCYHDAVESLRHERNTIRNKSFIEKLKDLFR